MVTSSLLLKINEHTAISRKGSNTARAAWSKVLGEQQREKGANLFLAKQYQLHISNERKGIVLREDNSSLYELTVRKLASEKYLWIEGVFLAESQYS